jgi:hypothetical protein
MKKQLLFILITILSINCYSQINFEKGYYINNSDQKINCLIKNVDWNNNPTEFSYKLTKDSDKQIANINTVKEFGIYNISKYCRHIVQIDKSSNDINRLDNLKKVIFEEEELFLKVLVEGKANLYVFKDGKINKYFYNKDDTKIEQLIYKKYLSNDNRIGEVNRYRQQLWNNLKHPSFKMRKIENLDYKKDDLIDFFVAYNESDTQKYVNYEKKQKKDLFNLSIRPGFNNSSLSIRNTRSSSRDTDFDNEFGIRFGIEAEFILSFNKNKWAFIIEPTYQYFKSEKELTSQNAKINYTSIELPIGIRHYFFLNEESKVFINGSFIVDFSSKSTIDFDTATNLDIDTRDNVALGIGYKYNDTYSLELRLLTSREILGSYQFWNSNYKTISIIFGYSIF